MLDLKTIFQTFLQSEDHCFPSFIPFFNPKVKANMKVANYSLNSNIEFFNEH